MSRFVTPMLRFARALKFAIELNPDEEGEIVGDFGFDKLSKADCDLVTTFFELQTAYPSTLKQQLDTAQTTIQSLQQEITNLKAIVTTLESKSSKFDQEQERFMKACVCVKLNQPPNRPTGTL